MAKLKVGFFSFTCCEGCSLIFIELLNKKFDEYMKKIEIKNMNSLKTTKKLEKLDVAFVEGAISSENEAPRLRQIRKNSRVLIALGSGACNGYPSNLRNTFNYEKKNKIQPLLKRFHQNESVEPIKHFVKVDAALNGCPVRAEDIDKMIRERIKCMK